MLEIRASFKVLIMLGGAFYMLLRSSEPLTASDDPAGVDAKLAELKLATEITLLIVPYYPTLFRSHVDKVRLPSVSCEYQIASGRGSAFGEVLDIIRRADIQYDDRPLGADLRVGMIFRRSGEVLWEFYSDDAGGKQKVRGSSGDRPVVASADLPSQLRAFLTHPDVVLIKTGNGSCPPS